LFPTYNYSIHDRRRLTPSKTLSQFEWNEQFRSDIAQSAP